VCARAVRGPRDGELGASITDGSAGDGAERAGATGAGDDCEGETSGVGFSRSVVEVAEGGAASGEGLLSAAPASAGMHSSEQDPSKLAAPNRARFDDRGR